MFPAEATLERVIIALGREILGCDTSPDGASWKTVNVRRDMLGGVMWTRGVRNLDVILARRVPDRSQPAKIRY